MPIRFDTSKSGFAVKPEGEYAATVRGWKYNGLSNGAKVGGSHAYSVQFALDEGGAVWDNFYIHPTTFWRLKNLFVAAGLDTAPFDGEVDFLTQAEADSGEYDDLENPVILDEMFAELVGASVTLTLGIRPANGENPEKNEVKKYKPALENAMSGWASAAA